ncbi:MAG: PQQ-binding-like beta-propeller repeat protein [Candidatus Poribacteria bacterium]|nr:PQQ-binding-like beta-propeller repeat protein [Candidatus Poribacteria bacterium]
MRKTISTVVVASLVFMAAQSAFAENWHHWRGARFNGTSVETGLPTTWSQTDNVVWRTPLPGPAGSTPVIWGDHIFLTTANGEGIDLVCIGTDGAIKWQKTFATENWAARGDEGNAASPSPTTDGKHVWAFASNGALACYDFAGNEVWKTGLEARYGRFEMNFTFASSPIVDGDRLYMQLIHSGAWLVIALDKHTGDELWKQERDSDARSESEQSYASPIIYRDDEREYLIVHGADYVTGHRLEDGVEIWRCGGLNPKDNYSTSFRLVASTAIAPGLIVVPSAKNGPVLGLRANLEGNVTDSESAYHWFKQRGTPDVSSPLIHDGLVYLCRENGNLVCLDAATGEQLYDESAHRHRHRASPVYADGKVYVTSRDGIITVVKAGRTFEVLAQNEMNESISSSPIISNGRVYLRTFDALYAIAASN